ncbi:MAG: hypothetical protein COA42_09460 [Alteromonadaceae bacterium]|nr:MAG: hypothetical protein COA42_09460 [Alteromonadaceae bacterium]
MSSKKKHSLLAHHKENDLAIVGLACRFPGAPTARDFLSSQWRGDECISEIPEDRWCWQDYHGDPKKEKNKTNSKWGGFISDVDKFDAAFFKISPREAAFMDPQQRIMLELAWRCIEDAGIKASSLSNLPIGVFIGACNFDYKELQDKYSVSIEGHTATGTYNTVIPNRISYCLNLRGPSVLVDSACASSLMALQQAEQAINSGQCEAALVGGISILCTPTSYISFAKQGMLSPDGRCKTFDDSADGYVRGEGAGLIYIKPLASALRDEDNIYGLVKSVSVNHGGSARTITSPNTYAQTQVICDAFERAQVPLASLNYIEAHGTGTPLGDPIEIHALKRAFSRLAKPPHSPNQTAPNQSAVSCGIGSVKTHIGHLEAAAGIAGLIKVLMALKTQQLPGLKNFNQLNKKISIKGSPFYLVTKNQAWPLPYDSDGQPLPRSAGVSSFGFGGVNSHAVLQEYTPLPSDNRSFGSVLVLPVSAKSDKCLLRYLGDIATFLQEHRENSDVFLNTVTDLAYTFLCARDPMRRRVVFIAHDTDTLFEQITLFLRVKEYSREKFAAKAAAMHERIFLREGDSDTFTWFNDDADAETQITQWLETSDINRVAKAWVNGYDVDWSEVSQSWHAQRISAPTYPFAGNRQWLSFNKAGVQQELSSELDQAEDELSEAELSSENKSPEAQSPLASYPFLHPMLHRNVSILGALRFSSQFNGDEFFFRDHLLEASPVLPGVAYLEMALAALKLSVKAPDPDDGSFRAVCWKHIVWSRPCIFHPEAPADLQLCLSSTDSDSDSDSDSEFLHWKILDGETDANEYSQGNICYLPSEPRAAPLAPVMLQEIKSRCTEGVWPGEQCYQTFAKMGLNYGPNFRCIQHLALGAGESIAQLQLSTDLTSAIGVDLHPGLLDAALQTLLAIYQHAQPQQNNQAPQALLPFALTQMQLHAGLENAAWVWTRLVSVPGQEGGSYRADMDVCDADGKILVSLRGFCARAVSVKYLLQKNSPVKIQKNINAKHESLLKGEELMSKASDVPCLYFSPQWVDATELDDNRSISKAEDLQHQVILLDFPVHRAHDLAAYLAADNSTDNLSEIPRQEPVDIQAWRATVGGGDIADSFTQHAQSLLTYLKKTSVTDSTAKNSTAKNRPRLIQVLIVDQGDNVLLAGLSALLKTAMQEQKQLHTQIILLAPEDNAPVIAARIYQNATQQHDTDIRYLNGQRQVARFQSLDKLQALDKPKTLDKLKTTQANQPLWKNNGVYLITGGAKGLGLVIAKEALRHAPQAHLVLLGRSELPTQQQASVQALGVNVRYYRVDVSDGEALQTLITQLNQQYAALKGIPSWQGAIDGVIHSAGLLDDTYLQAKTADSLTQVLAPKVRGTLNLDRALAEQHTLQFFILFSSVSALNGNVGQCDYAAANAFMDAFAKQRQLRCQRGECCGHTLAINWPLWRDGGMQVDASAERWLRRQMGIQPMTTDQGLSALYHCYHSGLAQLVVAVGDKDEVLQRLINYDLSASEIEVDDDLTGVAGGAGVVTDVVTGGVTSKKTESENNDVSKITDNTDPENQPNITASDADKRQVQQILTAMASEILHIDEHDLDLDSDFGDFGFDSITFTEFAIDLNERWHLDVSPPLFFEYPNISSFSAYLLEEYYDLVCATQAKPEDENPAASVQADSESNSDSYLDSNSDTSSDSYLDNSSDSTENPEIRKNIENKIAIIGMSGAFPHAPDIDSLWQNLRNEKHSIDEIPISRWDWRDYYGDPQQQNNQCNIKWGGFIDGMADFDPTFFGISPREAQWIDPQQRLLLQHCWAAIENAGYAGKSLAGSRTGVFLAIKDSGYSGVAASLGAAIEGFSATGNVPSVAPNRISYLLDLHGPSEAIETACSSSLVAMHRAINAIKNGECEQALVGGVNTMLTPDLHIGFNKAGMLSEDGRCKTFAADADGYVRGEGVAVILLKPLKNAQHDGDVIDAVILSSGVNHGGRANSLTSPNPQAQSALLVDVYRKAGIDFSSVGYIETHGTGTALGDPIEINGLKKAYQQLCQTPTEELANVCALGSIKSNIGHLEIAAGMAGVIKSVLQLKHRYLLRSLHCDKLNPYIDFGDVPFDILQQGRVWQTEDIRRAGVSSFGFGGTNAHVVLEEYPDAASAQGELSLLKSPDVKCDKYVGGLASVIIVSAKTPARLDAQLQQLADFVASEPVCRKNLAYTLQVGRDAMVERIAFVACSCQTLQAALRDVIGRGGAKSVDKQALLHDSSKWHVDDAAHQAALEWLNGEEIDWQAAWGEDSSLQPQRIHLPSYAFAKDYCWVDAYIPQSVLEKDQSKAKPQPPLAQGSNERAPVGAVAANLSPMTAQTEAQNLTKSEQSAYLQTLIPAWHSAQHEIDDDAELIMPSVIISTSERARQLFCFYFENLTYYTNIDGMSPTDLADDEIQQWLNHCDSLEHIVWVAPEEPKTNRGPSTTASAQSYGVVQLFNLVKALCELGQDQRPLEWTLITSFTQGVHFGDRVRAAHASVHGFAGAMAKEFPAWKLRILDMGEAERWPLIQMLRFPFHPQAQTRIYRNGEWLSKSWQVLRIPSSHKGNKPPVIRKGGVYLIIGGAGGLGVAWSEWLINHYQTQVVWLGRRPLDERIKADIDRLAELGIRPMYLQADASKVHALYAAQQTITDQFGPIHAVVHATIVLQDASIAQMDETQFHQSLDAKVKVATCLAEVFSEQNLDFVLFFSSIQSSLQSAGQSNYAAGCTFIDSYALQLTERLSCPVKTVNWGYWGGIGVVAQPHYRQRMAQMGLASLTPDESFAQLETLLATPLTQFAILKSTDPYLHESDCRLRFPAFVPGDICLYRVADDHALMRQWRRISRSLMPHSVLQIPAELQEPHSGLCHPEFERLLEGWLLAELLPLMQNAGNISERSLLWFQASLRYLQTRGYLPDTDSPEDLTEHAESPQTVIPKMASVTPDAQAQREQLQCFAERYPALAAHVALADACLSALSDIVLGNCSAPSVIFPQGENTLVENIYKNNPAADWFNTRLCANLVDYLQCVLSVRPGTKLRILEIGAGTGGTSASVLQALTPFAEHIDEYCYTDVSTAFLNHAQKHFREKAPYLKTQLFDVEQIRPGADNSPQGDFDVVIAANVLHATRNMRQTLRNVKTQMRPGAMLLLNELSRESLFSHLTFGLLDGWWLAQDPWLRLESSPALSMLSWRCLLEQEGFYDLAFPGEALHHHGCQIISALSDGFINTANASVPGLTQTPIPSSRHEVSDNSGHQAPQHVPSSISELGRELEQVSNSEPKHTTEIEAEGLEISDEIISDPSSESESESEYESEYECVDPHELRELLHQTLKQSVANATGLDIASINETTAFVDYGIDSILIVKLVNEINQLLGLVLSSTVLFDYNNVESLSEYLLGEHEETLKKYFHKYADEEKSQTLCKEVNLPLGEPEHEPQYESEHESQHELKINTEDSEEKRTAEQNLETSVQSTANADHNIPSKAEPNSPHQCLRLNGPGQIEQLQLSTFKLEPLRAGQIRIGVKAFALNFGDLLCVKGLYPSMPPYPFVPGFEAAGTVLEIGEGVSDFALGDAVIALTLTETLGGQASVITCDQQHVLAKPEKLDFEQACALPAAGVTMIDAFRKADLCPGERILIQTAAGGIGLIAVQLAKHYGAEIYATAGSAEKLAYLEALGVDHGIAYLEQDFEQAVMDLTQGQGVDVVINTLSGDAIAKGLRCLAPGGRYIELAMTALKSANQVDLSVLSDNQSFFASDLRKLALRQPKRLRTYFKEVLALVDKGIIQATVAQTLPLEDIQQAYRMLENRSNIGKVVVQVPEHVQKAVASFGNDSDNLNQGQAIERLSGGEPSKGESLQARNHFKEPIAIVGLSACFAKSPDVDTFWQHLLDGDDLVESVSRWPLAGSSSENTDPTPGTDPAQNKAKSCEHGSFLSDIDCFDAGFFNILPAEAQYMDVQQRIYLQQCWHALEDAAYAGDWLKGKSVGVYVGVTNCDYARLIGENAPAQSFWGNAASLIPARIAYYLNLKGPAIAVDAACASSLVAIHLACQSLRSEECDMALAGGIFVQSTAEFFNAANGASMLSASGRCRSFDAEADGFVPGEGAGVLILKRLQDAEADGDQIYASVCGSGVNQDGASNGITAPSAQAQQSLHESVYQRFGIDPADISLIEAHGTGTRLGDPMEHEALSQAFGTYTDKKQFCALGSVKSNIGHTIGAAGVAGVVKVLMALKHEKIPPSLHFNQQNSMIDFAASPFYINTELQPWPKTNHARLAAVNCFGFNGTNAHLVLRGSEVHCKYQSRFVSSAYLVVLSAGTEWSLQQHVKQMHEWLNHHSPALADLSFSLLMGRKHCSHRLVCVVSGLTELQETLHAWLGGREIAEPVRDNLIHCVLDGGLNREQYQRRDTANKTIESIVLHRNDPSRYRQLLSEIASWWSQGDVLDYAQLFEGTHSRRISLPLYPFERQRHWVENISTGGNASVQSQPLAQPMATDALVVKQRLRDMLALALDTPSNTISEELAFSDLGVDSAAAVGLIESINNEFKLTISTARIFQYSSVKALSEHVYQQLITLGIPYPADAPVTVEKMTGSESHGQHIRPQTNRAEPPSPIAIIGMDGQFPKSENLEKFWQNIAEGRDCISEIPHTRWNPDQYFDYDRQQTDTSYSKWMGMLEGAADFDPRFFSLSPREAELMDPQQRVFLQSAWRCIEAAGIRSSQLCGSQCGVYVGCGNNDYHSLIGDDALNAQGMLGASTSILAARIAYQLNLHGPCLSIDTACSSSLVALASACDSLLWGNCDIALSGGVCVLPGPKMQIMTAQAGMLSPNGRCFSFDQRADGFVPGEGVGVLLLKRLVDAERDGDTVHGLIRAWGVNQDGKTNGITAPNPQSQSSLQQQVYHRFNVKPTEIQLIEAHGTGTKLGDPVEVEALKDSFAALGAKAHFCALGSVKSNIGHLISAAGVAGVIKLVLCIREQKIPPLAGFQQVNSELKLADSPFYIAEKLHDWKVPENQPRCAAISSFGFSGTNAHAVIGQYLPSADNIQIPVDNLFDGNMLFVLSAKNSERLYEYVVSLRDYLPQLDDSNNQDLLKLAYTLQVGREPMPIRVAMLARNVGELRYKLDRWLTGGTSVDDDTVGDESDDLESKSTQYYNHDYEDDALNLYSAKIKDHRDWCQAFEKNAGAQEITELSTQLCEQNGEARSQWTALARCWVKGVHIVWESCYPNPAPARIHAPTYPFAREHYWGSLAGEAEAKSRSQSKSTVQGNGPGSLPQPLPYQPPHQQLHPLLHHRDPRADLIGFNSCFNGEEDFLADHKVNGVPTLPGVAYLEMAIAATRHLSAQDDVAALQKHPLLLLSNIVWAQALQVDKTPINVSIQLSDSATNDSTVNNRTLNNSAFEVYSDVDDTPKLHAQGMIRSFSIDQWPELHGSSFALAQGLEAMPLSALRDAYQKLNIDVDQLYSDFENLGLSYGDTHRCLQSVAAGEPGNILAQLRLPESALVQAGHYAFYPGLFDAALQACALVGSLVPGANMSASQGSNTALALPSPLLPFTLQSMVFIAPCTDHLWAHIQARPSAKTQGDNAKSQAMLSFDIQLLNDRGELLAILQGFYAREPSQTISSEPYWQTFSQGAQEVVSAGASGFQSLWCVTTEDARRKALDAGVALNLPEKYQWLLLDVPELQRVGAGKVSEVDNCAGFHALSLALFRQLKYLLSDPEKRKQKILLQLVLSTNDKGFSEFYPALQAMLKSASIEHNNFVGQVLLLQGEEPSGLGGLEGECGRRLSECLEQAGRQQKSECIRFSFVNNTLSGQSLRWRELILPRQYNTGDILWQAQDVVLITGGLGGVGSLIAKYLLSKVPEIRIVLCGRSAGGELQTAQALWQRLNLHNELTPDLSQLRYYQADCSQADQCQHLLNTINNDFGELNGIFHCAGIHNDERLLNKSEADFEQVLSNKISGVYHLDRLSVEQPLRAVVLFSSLSAVFGNAGQCDYATANAYLDQFCHYRNQLQGSGLRKGLAMSINWPLWQDGGMKIDTQNQQWQYQHYGFQALPSAQALQILTSCLSLELSHKTPQLAVMYGNTTKIRQKIFGGTALKTPEQVPAGNRLIEAGVVASTVLSERAPVEGTPEQVDDKTLLIATVDRIKTDLSEMLKIPISDLDGDTDLSEYGLDSIGLTQLCNRLNSDFDIDLMPTVFFEHATIDDFCDFLVDEYRNVLQRELFPNFAARNAPSNSLANTVISEAAEVQAGIPFVPVSASSSRGGATSDSVVTPITSSNKTKATSARADDNKESRLTQGYAIVGISGRFPGAEDVNQFWENIANSESSVRNYRPQPDEDIKDNALVHRWGEAALDSDNLNRDDGVFTVGLLENIACFDHAFFKISPREVAAMSYAQRLLIEEVWKAIEDSGTPLSEFSKQETAMYVAGSQNINAAVVEVDEYGITGQAASILVNRLSYLFNLRGPSEGEDTACSSFLVALHRAKASLAEGEAKQAVVAAVNVLDDIGYSLGFHKMGFLSGTGSTRSFDHQSDGYIRAEGAGAVVIKPLVDAQANGDDIYAVICGSGVYHAGKTLSLITPNPGGIREASRRAWSKSGVDPRYCQYVEAHGIGSSMGDAAELAGIQRGLQSEADIGEGGLASYQENKIRISTLKADIGHPEFASGIAALIKSIMALRNGVLPGINNFQQLHKDIKLDQEKFEISSQHGTWPENINEYGEKIPRYWSLNSYGFGGVNAHVVLREFEVDREIKFGQVAGDESYLFILSAQTNERLLAYLQTWKAYLSTNIIDHLDAVCYTLQCGREIMAARIAIIFNQQADLLENIQHAIEEADNGMPANKSGRSFVSQGRGRSGTNIGDTNEGQDFLSSLLKNKKFSKLAEFWVDGLSINWAELYVNAQASSGQIPPTRLHGLPLYPFSKTEHPSPSAGQSNASTSATSSLPALITAPAVIPGEDDKQDTSAKARDFKDDPVTETIKTAISHVLHLPYEHLIDDYEVIAAYGLDSINTIELINILLKAFPGIESLNVDPMSITIAGLSREISPHCQPDDVGLSKDFLPIVGGAGNADALEDSSVSDSVSSSSSSTSGVAQAPISAPSASGGSLLKLDPSAINPFTSALSAESHDRRDVSCIKPSTRPKQRLLIFYCLGFGQHAYQWVKKLPNDVEVWGVGSTNYSSWQILTQQLAERVRSLFNLPVVVWGHSMGAIVGFEVLAYLEKYCQLQAQRAIFSSCAAPSVFSLSKYSAPIYDIDLSTTMDMARDLLAKHHFLPPGESGILTIDDAGLANDVALYKAYELGRDKVISTPVVVVQANNDLLLPDVSILERWKACCNEIACYEEVEGTHMFFMNPPRRFKALLSENTQSCEVSLCESGGVYSLVSMVMGSHDQHSYPLGHQAQGRVIYTEEGYMATHLWHPNRQANNPRESFITYLAYCGEFDQVGSLIHHHVFSSTLRDYEDKKLSRFISGSENLLCLTPAPLIVDMSNNEELPTESYSQLKWRRLKDNEHSFRRADGSVIEGVRLDDVLAGAYLVDSVLVNDVDDGWGEGESGVLLITSSGLISLVLSQKTRHKLHNKRPEVASDEEIELSLQGVMSFCGTIIYTSDNRLYCHVDVSQNLLGISLTQIDFHFSEVGLVLNFAFTEDNDDTRSFRIQFTKQKARVLDLDAGSENPTDSTNVIAIKKSS